MLKRSMMLLCALGILAVASRSEAQLWTSAIGAGCIPDSAAVAAGNYQTGISGVSFAPNAEGTIRLICPWPLLSGGGKLDGMFMTYWDPDGANTNTRVSATMYWTQRGSSSSHPLGTCDSNSAGNTGVNELTCAFPIHTMSTNNYYWWEIILQRASGTSNVSFYSISPGYSP